MLKMIEETPDACSITFEVPLGAEADFDHRPGQFLTLAVPSERNGLAARCYSISSSPRSGGPITITVKRTAGGYASNWLCDHLRAGSQIRVLPPSGVFTPASLDADLLLIAAGSGITPVISIARAALDHGTGHVALFYANRDKESVIFAAELAALEAAHPTRLHVQHWLESDRGLPTREHLSAFVTANESYDAFVCGPAPFMELTTEVLRQHDFPSTRHHKEKYLSLAGNPFDGATDEKQTRGEMKHAESDDHAARVGDTAPFEGVSLVEIRLAGQTHVFDDWSPDTTLLAHLVAKGVDAPYSCRSGECSSCAVRLVEGEVRMMVNDVLDVDDLEDGLRLACQSLPVTDVVRATYD